MIHPCIDTGFITYFSTDNTPACVCIFEHAKRITMHVVLMKYFCPYCLVILKRMYVDHRQITVWYLPSTHDNSWYIMVNNGNPWYPSMVFVSSIYHVKKQNDSNYIHRNILETSINHLHWSQYYENIHALNLCINNFAKFFMELWSRRFRISRTWL